MALYRFGYHGDPFEFDSSTGELVKDGYSVRLRPQPARVLAHLLERHGELVTRAELQRAIWPEGTFVHFDYGLNSCMKQIRAALGGAGSAPGYIETLVKRGFRVVAPVTLVLTGTAGHLGRYVATIVDGPSSKPST
jgi:DNA-binding winged helix-turn-helix (wHTH) protein